VDTAQDDGEWFSGYVGRVTELLEDAGHVNAELVQQWGARSLQGEEWTVDTMTADMIEAWASHASRPAMPWARAWPRMALAAWSPDTTAASMQPALMPESVQSPARNRLS
jgi:hypothetical protein